MNLRRHRNRIFLLAVSFLFLLFIFISSSAGAQTASSSSSVCTSVPECVDQKLDCSHCQDYLNNKISDFQGQEKTLASQIGVMDSQIKLTQLRINATKQEIANLTDNIKTTTKKIENLEESLTTLTKVLGNRIVATYEVGSIQPFQILLSSSNVSDFFSRLNYLRLVQAHDKKLVFEMQQAKMDYSNQKDIFEEKKKKVESLKKQLENYTTLIEQEKKDKQALLAATQNSEIIYQQRLQAALAEQKAIQRITAGGGNVVDVGKVKEGDTLGYMISGRSVCSSGTHLHFEVYKDSVMQDPSQYLSSKGVTFDNSPDGSFSFGGSWSWPLSEPILIEQGFGMTYWARIGWYGGGPHTGIDMYSNSSSVVRAVKDGELFRGSIACGGGQLLFARVDQSDGVQTFYLHIN